MSRVPARRVAAIKNASADPVTVLGVIEGDRDVERALHQEFASFRLRGEWFRAAPELMARIAKIARPIAEFAPSPRERDAHTRQAASWVIAMEDRHATYTGISVKAARDDLAERAGLSPTVLRNLRTGRALEVTAHAYSAIYGLYIVILGEHAEQVRWEIINLQEQEAIAAQRQ